jgi:succinate dehydrogenase / fumarate reductase cytochrome b subunit
MAVSILHRITGAGLTIAGLAVLTWWLMAIATGADAYATFAKVASSWIGLIVLIGLTWAFFQHLFSGIRHLVTDTGMGFELRSNKLSAIATIVGSILATVLIWAYWMGAFK